MQALVVGIIVLANAFWLGFDWWKLIGVVAVLWGILSILKPTCGCCESSCESVPEKKKKQ